MPGAVVDSSGNTATLSPATGVKVNYNGDLTITCGSDVETRKCVYNPDDRSYKLMVDDYLDGGSIKCKGNSLHRHVLFE